LLFESKNRQDSKECRAWPVLFFIGPSNQRSTMLTQAFPVWLDEDPIVCQNGFNMSQNRCLQPWMSVCLLGISKTSKSRMISVCISTKALYQTFHFLLSSYPDHKNISHVVAWSVVDPTKTDLLHPLPGLKSCLSQEHASLLLHFTWEQRFHSNHRTNKCMIKNRGGASTWTCASWEIKKQCCLSFMSALC
jgi:hypothetical protein